MPRTIRIPLLLALAALLALGALAAGCGGDDDGATTPGVTGAQPPPPPTTPPVETTPPADTGAMTGPTATDVTTLPAETGAMTGPTETAATTTGGETSTSAASGDVSGTIEFTGVWTGPEQESFQAVIDGFNEQYPDVEVSYNGAGDQLPTVLGTAVEGGNPPDMAAIPQPGTVRDFAQRGALVPLDFARDQITSAFGQSVVDVGSIDGELYGLLFKAANKSTVFYNTQVLEDAGVQPPATWDELTQAAQTISASGVPPYSIGGADGWTLTDLFENVYLRTAGPEMYDQLAAHQIPWTDESVTTALRVMADVVGNGDLIAGGTSGALQTDFPTSVTQLFDDPPKAAMVMEGDFVGTFITDQTDAEPGTDFDVFDFPSIEGSQPAVVGGGDMIVAFSDSPAVQAFVQYLATPEAAEIWAQRGGFSSLNREVDPNVYANPILRKTSEALSGAETFRFDLSDLQPAAFGATVGQGMWGLFQEFVNDPSDVDGIAQRLEDAAQQAYDAAGATGTDTADTGAGETGPQPDTPRPPRALRP
ncbi:MAG: extracellular solute-binding protein [Thermoleophilia bacterium]